MRVKQFLHNSSAANLRQAWKLRKVGLALLQEGVLALFPFLSHIVEHGGVARQLLDACQTVGISVEGRFEEAQCDRALLQNCSIAQFPLLAAPKGRLC